MLSPDSQSTTDSLLLVLEPDIVVTDLDSIYDNDQLLVTTKDRLCKIQAQLERMQMRQFFPPVKIPKTDFDMQQPCFNYL